MDVNTIMILLSILPHFNLIIQIFKHYQINDGILVHCYSATQTILLQKALNDGDLKISAVLHEDVGRYQFKGKVGFILDTSCVDWIKAFDKYTNFEHGHQITWIINTIDMYSTIRVLTRHHLRIDSKVIVINSNGTIIRLYEAYNTGFKSRGLFVMRNIGFWNSSLNLYERSRRDMHGAKLKCVSVITEDIKNETFMHFLKESRHEKPDTLHKLKFFTAVGYLQEMYNFSVDVQRTNSWGYSRNGTFDGLVGSLQRQEADIGCSPVLFKFNRAKVLDYVVPTWQTKDSFLFRQPKYQRSFVSVYSRPLDENVWRYVVLVLLTAGVILNVMLRIQVINASLDEEKDSSLSLVWLVIFSAVCQQGMTVTRKTVSTKMVMFVISMFSLTLYQFYNANVLSGLLNEQYDNIRNLKDLLESDLKAGVENMLFNKDYFKRTTDRVSLDIYNKKIATHGSYNFFDTEYGMELVRRGGFAFHVDTSAAYRVMRRTFSDSEICEVSEVPLFPPQYVAAVAVKGSEYREYITLGITRMLESGLMNRLKSVWDSRKPPCSKLRYNSIVAVNIQEFSMPLIFLASGIIVAAIILLCEIYFSKNNELILRRRDLFVAHLKIVKKCKRMRGYKEKCTARKRIPFIN